MAKRRKKTDRNDCDAILEAARCKDIHPVPVKSRKKSCAQRINLLRGILREAVIEAPAATAAFIRAAHELVDRPERRP